GVQAVRGARHQVARAISYIEFGVEPQKTREQVIAQVVLNLPRNANQYPACPKRKKSLDEHRYNQNRAVDSQRMAAEGRIEREQRMKKSSRSSRKSGERFLRASEQVRDRANDQLRQCADKPHQHQGHEAERGHTFVAPDVWDE